MELKALKENAKVALAKIFAAGVELSEEEMEGLKAFCQIGGLLSNLDANDLELLNEAGTAEELMQVLDELASLSVERRFAVVYGV